MGKEFILYDEAVDLKELGFDEPCSAIYNKEREFSTVEDLRCPYTYLNNTHPIQKFGISICIPTYQEAFQWFDKNYGLVYEKEESELVCLKKMISTAKSTILYWCLPADRVS